MRIFALRAARNGNGALTVEGVEKAEPLLLRAQAIHPKVAMIAFNLACYRKCRWLALRKRKLVFSMRSSLIKRFAELALDDEDLRHLWDWIAHLH